MDRISIYIRRELAAVHNLFRADPFAPWLDVWIAYRARRRGALQKVRELAPVVGLVRRSAPRVVVEIGTAAGGSFYAWTRAARSDALLVSIDLPGGRFGGGGVSGDAARIRALARGAQQVDVVRADSHLPQTVEALVSILDGRAVDFLFIDGDHSYGGVRRDFELYAPLVRAGGVVAFHDIVPHPPSTGCEVARLWEAVKQGRRHTEFVDAGGSGYGGIGVLYGGG
jgi:predicted O-methyltransferase YrrM